MGHEGCSEAIMQISGFKDDCRPQVRQQPRSHKASGEPVPEPMRTSGASASLFSAARAPFRRGLDGLLGPPTTHVDREPGRYALPAMLADRQAGPSNRTCAH